MMESFRLRLEETHAWPCLYTFKFIVPQDRVDQVKALFPGRPVSTRPSKHGKYVSVTAEEEMESSLAVVMIYREAAKIEGIISQ